MLDQEHAEGRQLGDLMTTEPAPGPFLRQDPLPLGAPLRPPLLTGLRRILRRRLGTRPRVLPRLLLKPPQAISMPLHLSSQIQHELHARLPAGVIDRLRLSALHTTKIRR